MAATQITLVIDRQNRLLVPFGASVSRLPDLSQRDTVAILIQIADPPTNTINGVPTILTSAEIQAGKPRVTISQKATGTPADENTWVLAKMREADFTWSDALSGFIGNLNLNTAQLQTFMGVNESCQAEFEVRFSSGGNLSTLLPGPKNKMTIWANVDEGADPPIDILNGVVTYTLPLQLRSPGTNNLFVIQESAPGVVTIDLVP